MKRGETTSSTVRKFHEKYFGILEDYFGLHHDTMKKKRQGIYEALNNSLTAYDPSLADSVVSTLYEELRRLDWDGVANSIKQQNGVKAQLEAAQESLERNPLQRLALYADTTLISGRLDNPKRMIGHPLGDLAYALYCSLSELEVKDLFLADVEPPICAIVRSTAFTSTGDQVWKELNTNDTVTMCSEMFGRNFSSNQEVENFFRKYKTPDDLSKATKKAGPFLGSHESGSEMHDRLRQMIEASMRAHYMGFPQKFSGLNDPNLLADTMLSNIHGSFGIANAQLLTCGSYGAQPSADEIQQWRWLAWKLEHDNEFLAEKFGVEHVSRNSLVINALQLDGFRWLGNVPVEAIVRLRQEGELQDLRDVLSREIKGIETARDEDFVEVTRQVSYNLNQEFKRHRGQVRQLDQRFRRRYNFDVASAIVSGTIGVMCAMFPPLALVAGVVGGGSLINTISDVLEERSTRAELRKKPVALLFEAYPDKKNVM
jgi:hypothetical protein